MDVDEAAAEPAEPEGEKGEKVRLSTVRCSLTGALIDPESKPIIEDAVRRTSLISYLTTLLIQAYLTYLCARDRPIPTIDHHFIYHASAVVCGLGPKYVAEQPSQSPDEDQEQEQAHVTPPKRRKTQASTLRRSPRLTAAAEPAAETAAAETAAAAKRAKHSHEEEPTLPFVRQPASFLVGLREILHRRGQHHRNHLFVLHFRGVILPSGIGAARGRCRI